MSHSPAGDLVVAHKTLDFFNDPWMQHYLGFWTETALYHLVYPMEKYALLCGCLARRDHTCAMFKSIPV